MGAHQRMDVAAQVTRSAARKPAKSVVDAVNKTVKKTLSKPGKWSTSPGDSLWLSEAEAAKRRAAGAREADALAPQLIAAANQARRAEALAADAAFFDDALNDRAESAIAAWRNALRTSRQALKKSAQKTYNRVPWLLALGVGLAMFLGLGVWLLGERPRRFFMGFAVIFALAALAYVIAGQAAIRGAGFGYAVWAIVLGLLVSNTIGTPKFIKDAAKSELFIKSGLVLLGAEVLLGKIAAIGAPGIVVAWVVTPIVLLSTYFFGQRILKIPSKTLNLTISADMSVCGVSAAIATAAACRAKKEELTLAVGLSMVFTSIMMVVMPAACRALGIGPVLGGAWLGGTLDATGAVAAAGAFLGETALQVAATIKMIQNILIGVVAFVVATIWARHDLGAGSTQGRGGFGEVWRRFPKFVLGFVGASAAFSLMHELMTDSQAVAVLEQGVVQSLSKPLRGWLFALAFVSIGLSTDFRALAGYFRGGKPLVLYVCGQLFNIVLTFAVAYVMFEVVFAGRVSP